MADVDASVLSDRLTLACQVPTASNLWHSLFRVATAAPPDRQRQLLDQVRSKVPMQGIGGFLAATFAHGLTDDVQDLAAASRVFLADDLPVDTGQALLNITFSMAMRAGETAGKLNALFRASG